MSLDLKIMSCSTHQIEHLTHHHPSSELLLKLEPLKSLGKRQSIDQWIADSKKQNESRSQLKPIFQTKYLRIEWQILKAFFIPLVIKNFYCIYSHSYVLFLEIKQSTLR